jgi:hypothetical protein
MSDLDTITILNNQISVLTNDIKQLYADIAGITQGCSARHRKNLTAELSRLESDLAALRTLIQTNADAIENTGKEIKSIYSKLQECVSQVNILILKMKDLESLLQKSKEAKNNFIMQVAIIVLATIITTVLGFIASAAWNNSKTNSYSTQPPAEYHRPYRNPNYRSEQSGQTLRTEPNIKSTP